MPTPKMTNHPIATAVKTRTTTNTADRNHPTVALIWVVITPALATCEAIHVDPNTVAQACGMMIVVDHNHPTVALIEDVIKTALNKVPATCVAIHADHNTVAQACTMTTVGNNAFIQGCMMIAADRNRPKAAPIASIIKPAQHTAPNTALATCEVIHVAPDTVAVTCAVKVANNNAANQAWEMIAADPNHRLVALTEVGIKLAPHTVVPNSNPNHAVHNTATATCEVIRVDQNAVAPA
jgi:hypothetical protein